MKIALLWDIKEKGTLIGKGALRKHVSNGVFMVPGDRPFQARLAPYGLN